MGCVTGFPFWSRHVCPSFLDLSRCVVVVGAHPEAMPPARTTPAELTALQKQINNLARRCKRARLAETRAASAPAQGAWCQPSSPRCLMVYILSGRSSTMAAEFMLGRGRRTRWTGRLARNNKPEQVRAEHVQRCAPAIEKAFACAPPSAVTDLERGLDARFEMGDLLCAHKYVLEHKLCAWIAHQNMSQGLAPSREQVLAQLPVQMSDHASPDVRRRLGAGAARSQRRWLARYRRRWGARFGVLRSQEHLCAAERGCKAGCGALKGSSGIVIFRGMGAKGSVWGPSRGPAFGFRLPALYRLRPQNLGRSTDPD